MSITTAQIRGARGILNWSQADLAERTGISATSIGSIENGVSTPRANTLTLIQKAFEGAGIEFIGMDGVKMRSGNIRVFRGQQGLVEFFENVYDELRNSQEEVLVSNVDERMFVKAMGEQTGMHLDRMSALKKVRYKILIREGDTYMPAASYAEYRWISKELFASVPFYVYSDKLAIILFDPELTVIALEYAAIATAYKAQFLDMWNRAKPANGESKAGTG
jgi:transcriptional regulator with XRE-family HTH domain